MRFLLLSIKHDKVSGDPLGTPAAEVVDAADERSIYCGAETVDDVREMWGVSHVGVEGVVEKLISVTPMDVATYVRQRHAEHVERAHAEHATAA